MMRNRSHPMRNLFLGLIFHASDSLSTAFFSIASVSITLTESSLSLFGSPSKKEPFFDAPAADPSHEASSSRRSSSSFWSPDRWWWWWSPPWGPLVMRVLPCLFGLSGLETVGESESCRCCCCGWFIKMSSIPTTLSSVFSTLERRSESSPAMVLGGGGGSGGGLSVSVSVSVSGAGGASWADEVEDVDAVAEVSSMASGDGLLVRFQLINLEPRLRMYVCLTAN
mmetsp:Transcript_9926/g.22817  ORF Transcript_9926/g.22817 Transcript_9926/m.22817 type:complete len:225 (+) Transcript_9926:2824-3498(+)